MNRWISQYTETDITVQRPNVTVERQISPYTEYRH